MELKVKLQVVKSITALICVGSICATAAVTSDKVAQAIKSGATANSGTEVVEQAGSGEENTEVAEDVTEAVTEEATETPVEGNTPTEEGSTTAAANTNATTKKNTNNGVPQTKAEIIAYCNTALNNAKAAKPGYTKNYVRKCEGDLPSLVLNLIKQNKKTTMKKGGDNKEDFPAAGFAWSSKLRESDVASYNFKQNGQYYEITLKLGKETNPGKGETSSYGRVMSVITQDDAKAMLSAIKTVTLQYHDGYVYAKIDSKTGKLVKAEFSASADLSANIAVLGDVKADNVISTETFSDFVW